MLLDFTQILPCLIGMPLDLLVGLHPLAQPVGHETDHLEVLVGLDLLLIAQRLVLLRGRFGRRLGLEVAPLKRLLLGQFLLALGILAQLDHNLDHVVHVDLLVALLVVESAQGQGQGQLLKEREMVKT